MVSKNSQTHHYISIPADWGLPKFNLGQRIETLTVFPDTILIQTGKISGIEYVKAESLWVIQERVRPGWYYSIELDADDPCYSASPVINVNESEISKINELTEAPAQR